jgi:hypothetical protein
MSASAAGDSQKPANPPFRGWSIVFALVRDDVPTLMDSPSPPRNADDHITVALAAA